MAEEFKGLFCTNCGANAFQNIEVYTSPDDPQESMFHCKKCGKHSHSLSHRSTASEAEQ